MSTINTRTFGDYPDTTVYEFPQSAEAHATTNAVSTVKMIRKDEQLLRDALKVRNTATTGSRAGVAGLKVSTSFAQGLTNILMIEPVKKALQMRNFSDNSLITTAGAIASGLTTYAFRVCEIFLDDAAINQTGVVETANNVAKNKLSFAKRVFSPIASASQVGNSFFKGGIYFGVQQSTYNVFKRNLEMTGIPENGQVGLAAIGSCGLATATTTMAGTPGYLITKINQNPKEGELPLKGLELFKKACKPADVWEAASKQTMRQLPWAGVFAVGATLANTESGQEAIAGTKGSVSALMTTLANRDELMEQANAYGE